MKIIESLSQRGIGVHPINERDFYQICEAEGIEIIWSEERFSFYFSTDFGKFITLPKRLTGLKLLFAGLHELGHHFLSAGKPYAVEWHNMHDGRDEAECDAVALIALMPIGYLHRTDFLDTYPQTYAKKLYDERLRLYFLYGV